MSLHESGAREGHKSHVIPTLLFALICTVGAKVFVTGCRMHTAQLMPRCTGDWTDDDSSPSRIPMFIQEGNVLTEELYGDAR